MRKPDVRSVDGSFEGWRVPLERVQDWVTLHPERVHQASRDELFARTWRDLWYIHVYVSGGIIDDEIAVQRWIAVSLRDLRSAPTAYPRMYAQAEWELVGEFTKGGRPPVSGDGLYDRANEPPLLLYQFHGLPESVVMDVGDGSPFTVYGVELLADGVRSDGQNAHVLSRMVNVLRERHGLRALAIGEGDPVAGREGSGLLIELEDESTVTLA